MRIARAARAASTKRLISREVSMSQPIRGAVRMRQMSFKVLMVSSIVGILKFFSNVGIFS